MFKGAATYEEISEHFGKYPKAVTAVTNIMKAGLFGMGIFVVGVGIFAILTLLQLSTNPDALLGFIVWVIILAAVYLLPSIPMRKLGGGRGVQISLWVSIILAVPGCLSILGIWYLILLIKALTTFKDYRQMFDYSKTTD